MTSSTAQPRSSSLSEDRQTNEPSMEEILASIRRLIAEDEAELGAASALSEGRRPPPSRVARSWTAAPAAPAAREHGPMRGAAVHGDAEPEEAEVLAPVDEANSLPLSEFEVAHQPDAPLLGAPTETKGGLASEARGDDDAEPRIATLDESFMAEELMEQHEVFVAEEPGEVEGFAEAEASARAPALVSANAAASIAAQFQSLAASRVLNDSGLLHEYAREMLRPMLKAWLDDNLPALVERLVRAEIERVARGGRR
jgi:uncharacterized protein